MAGSSEVDALLRVRPDTSAMLLRSFHVKHSYPSDERSGAAGAGREHGDGE